MYERNAVILERYFEKAFGYDNKNSIKSNFKDYKELVEDLENYKNISDEEDVVIQEYDAIASRIREIQSKQEILNNKNNKYQEERANIFQNIDENSNNMIKKINSINNDIQSINEQIEENAKLYVETVNEFNEKSDVRTKIGKKRRVIEEKYNNKLEEILDNYSNISLSQVKQAKQFGNLNIEEIKKQLQEKIRKNGEKEKVPFNEDVISQAINLSIDIQKKETEVLVNIYEKTNRLFGEIKNGSAKIAKHKKLIKDSQSKLEFINAMKEYLVQFLDNERITAVNGEEEHTKLMKEACKNIEEDIVQIDNLYTLLLKEISKKIMKKNYNDLYKLEYLKDLESKSEDFEEEIKKLNLPVTIINPNYWRIEGMRRIYNTFSKCVTEYYGRDLSKYTEKFEKKKEEENKKDKNIFELAGEKLSKGNSKETKKEDKEDDEKIDNKKELIDKNTKKNSIDKKIDFVLEMNKEDDDWEDDWEESDEDEDKENDDEIEIDEVEDKKEKEKEKKKNSSKSKKKEATKKTKSKSNKKKEEKESEDEAEEIEEEDDFFDDFDEEKMDEIEYVDEDEEVGEDIVEKKKKSEDIDDMLNEEDEDDDFEEGLEEDDTFDEDEEDLDEDDTFEEEEDDDDDWNDEDEDDFDDLDEDDWDEDEDEDEDDFDEDEDEDEDNFEDDDFFEEEKSKKKSKNKMKVKAKDKKKNNKVNKNEEEKDKKSKNTKISKSVKNDKNTKTKETKKDKDEKSSKYIPKDTAKNEAKEDWGNEFINIKEKETKKKRGWFFR